VIPRIRQVSAALVAVAAGIAAVAVLAPPGALDPVGTVGVFGVGVVLLGVLAAGWRILGPEVGGGVDAGRSREAAGADDEIEETLGDRIDAVVGAVDDPTVPWRAPVDVEEEAAAIRADLHEMAVEAVANDRGCSRETASELVDAGDWTDDPYAASFLRSSAEPALPLRVRVTDWLRGRHLRRRIEATVDAIVATSPAGSIVASTGAGAGARSPEAGAGGDGAVTAELTPPDDAPGRAGGASDGALRTATARLEPGGTPTGTGADIGLVVGIAAAVVGTAIGNAAVVLSGVVGCAYAAYGYAMPEPGSELSVERWVESTDPAPGDEVRVTLTVENVGGTVVPDLRVTDGAPADLVVVDGATAGAASLAPGESLTLSYRIETKTGTHPFGPTELVGENLSGTATVRGTATVGPTLSCDYAVEEVPMSDQTTPFEGRVASDSGGSGTEFYATREYQPGDPPNRIDWNRYASTREPTTVQFRERRAAVVTVVLDADFPGDAAPGSMTGDPVSLGRYASRLIVEDLLAAHNDVGAARIDSTPKRWTDSDREEIHYLEPATDGLQPARARRLFADDDPTDVDRVMTLDSVFYESDDTASTFSGVLSRESQVLLVTPLLHDRPVSTVTRLMADGRDVTVVVLDVLPDTLGGRIDRLERARRITILRARGAGVLTWAPDESLSFALAKPVRRTEVVT